MRKPKRNSRTSETKKTKRTKWLNSNAREASKKTTNEIKRKEEEMNDSVRSNEQAAAKSAAVAEAEMKRTVEESLAENAKLQKDLELARESLCDKHKHRENRVEFYENRYNANGKGITR